MRSRSNESMIVRLCVALIFGFLFAWAFFLGGRAFGHHSETHNWLLSWIPVQCCVTNDCCFEVKLSDLEPLDGDRWRIKASGQVVQRSGWSPDGRYWRCACDAQADYTWLVHPKANTRCLFVPPMGS